MRTDTDNINCRNMTNANKLEELERDVTVLERSGIRDRMEIDPDRNLITKKKTVIDKVLIDVLISYRWH